MLLLSLVTIFTQGAWPMEPKGRVRIKGGNATSGQQRRWACSPSADEFADIFAVWGFSVRLQNTCARMQNYISQVPSAVTHRLAVRSTETSPPGKPAPALHKSTLFCAVVAPTLESGELASCTLLQAPSRRSRS